MMEYQKQLKVQAYLDGELSESESREVSAWLANDREAMDLATELRNTREALSGFEKDARLAESRDFYWSKIKSQIEREERPTASPVPVLSWSARLRRLLMPATGIAVAALMLLVVTHETGQPGVSEGSAETALEDSGAFTYHDSSAGATLVWLSYPADNEMEVNTDDQNSLD